MDPKNAGDLEEESPASAITRFSVSMLIVLGGVYNHGWSTNPPP